MLHYKMHRRQRRVVAVNSVPLFNPMPSDLSDTEEMEDEDIDAETDSEEVFFIPQQHTARIQVLTPSEEQVNQEVSEVQGGLINVARTEEINEEIREDRTMEVDVRGEGNLESIQEVVVQDDRNAAAPPSHPLNVPDEDDVNQRSHFYAPVNRIEDTQEDSNDEVVELERDVEERRNDSDLNQIDARRDENRAVSPNPNSSYLRHRMVLHDYDSTDSSVESTTFSLNGESDSDSDAARSRRPRANSSSDSSSSHSRSNRGGRMTTWELRPHRNPTTAERRDSTELSSVAIAAEAKDSKSENVDVASVSKLSPCKDDDEAQTCSICFEAWSNSGAHRIVSLKCGHLFGKECIERWLKGQRSKCPQCNAKASRKDLRVIYAKCLKVQDTTEKERLAHQIEKLQKEKAQDEREKAQHKIKMSLDSQLIKKLQEELRMLKEAVKSSSRSTFNMEGAVGNAVKRYKLSWFRSFDLAKTGCCRVMAFNEWLNMLVVSIQSQLDMFPGFGIRKINVLDFKVENYIPLHSKQIRDLAFNPFRRDLLLSVGMDKVAKITNVSSNATVVSYSTDFPLWSCCWNTDNSSEFFAGTSTGLLYHFNTVKNTSGPLHTYPIGNVGPIVSLSYVNLSGNGAYNISGLLVTRLRSVSFVQVMDEGTIKDHPLSIEGSFSHTAFDSVTKHLLATCRPNDRIPHARHMLCELATVNISEEPSQVRHVPVVQEVHSFHGSTTMKLLSRACLSQDLSGDSVVILNEESTSSVKVYDVRTASQIQIIKTASNIIDIIPVKVAESHYVAFLAEKSVKFFKWIEHL